jgi:4-amino-4-deoxy-L-arabinose transferase-like glycosyltransferase
MPQASWGRSTQWLLPAIVVVYVVLGSLYAVYTPAWQAPDEPAHYNYVQDLAEQHRFPVLKAGDFPAAYLEEIKAARFPPQMSVAPIRYEFHQPPLYYLLAVPVYRVFGGQLLPLRLFSVSMGAMLLVVVCWTVQSLAPNRPGLALGVTAFVAFLPMHLAMTAAANNDTLAELLLVTILLLAIRYLKLADLRERYTEGTRLLFLLGVTTGLALVTKSSIYIAVPLVLLAIGLKQFWLDKRSLSSGLKAGAIYLLPAVALGLPWWLRNMAIYGWGDFLGLGRHDQVVVGQLRTAEFVAEKGLAQVAQDFFVTTFHSFWGQFGWMGVLLDQRIYQAVAILSALAVTGFVIWAARMWRSREKLRRWQVVAGWLLVMLGLFSVASYLWYNMQFVQHQGRYLFTALVPISVAVALGWREVLRRARALPLAVLLLVVAVILMLTGLLSNWPLLMVLATSIALVIRRFLPARLDPFIQSCPYLGLILVDLASLFLFIVPQLAV